MDDVQPSTSKQDGREERNDSSKSDHKENTNSRSWSHTYSTRSQTDMANMGIDIPKPVFKRGHDRAKSKERQKRQRERHAGRVDKRRRSATKSSRNRRAPTRRPQKRRERRESNISLSTIFTRLSPNSNDHLCQHCGHRCCERSFNGREYRRYEKHNRRKIDKKDLRGSNRANKGSVRHISGAAANQVGSRAQMLSPLFIKTNYTPDEDQHQNDMYSEVSPEMIYEAVRYLSMWKEEVKTEAILGYIKFHYPVNPDSDALLKDLLEKLRIAAIVGIITRASDDSWLLPTALQERSLAETHVTIFWQAYADTMSPVTKTERIPQVDNDENQTQ